MGKSQLQHNIAVHNKIANKYERIHGEIYNQREQDRLRKELASALSCVQTGASTLRALDFGCGAGNLTKHLTDLGCEVVAADVSTGFLDLVLSRTYKEAVTSFHLNGIDLAGLEDASFDAVALYSVLHHVPDYLSLMKEFARVLKPGGVLYIDHEASPSVWKGGIYEEFKAEMKRSSRADLAKYFIPTNYIDRLIRLFINKRYQREGDIHVFADDHIEWDVLRAELVKYGVQPLKEEDYLLFRRGYDESVYSGWKERFGDMRIFVGRKDTTK